MCMQWCSWAPPYQPRDTTIRDSVNAVGQSAPMESLLLKNRDNNLHFRACGLSPQLTFVSFFWVSWGFFVGLVGWFGLLMLLFCCVFFFLFFLSCCWFGFVWFGFRLVSTSLYSEISKLDTHWTASIKLACYSEHMTMPGFCKKATCSQFAYFNCAMGVTFASERLLGPAVCLAVSGTQEAQIRNCWASPARAQLWLHSKGHQRSRSVFICWQTPPLSVIES